jgi:ubiquitin carboxyl-terminal hydrolase 22/27/51
MVEDASNAVKLKNAYAEIQTELITNPVEAHTTRDSKDPKKETITTLKPTFLCLQCKTISSAKDRDVHGQNRRHYWCKSYGIYRLRITESCEAIESRSGCLYCGQCDDFIYDPSLERIRIQQNLPSALSKFTVRP